MGYSSIVIQPGFQCFTATFENMAAEEYNLDNVIVLNEDGTKWDVQDTATIPVVIQKMTTDGKGKYDSTKIYSYRHYYATKPKVNDKGLGWYTGSTTTRTSGDIMLKNGEGLSINNKLAVPIRLQFSGQVSLNPQSFKVGPGFSLVGNMTPVDVNLNDVQILDADGEVLDIADTATVPVVIQKMTTDGLGKYDSTKIYSYRHYYATKPKLNDKGLGWYTGSTTTRIGAEGITITAGQAFSINNKLDQDIIVKFPTPIK